MPTIIDGKKTSETIKNEIAARVAEIKQEGGKVPHLAAVLVGDDGASQTYVNAKVKACEQIGFESTLVRLEDNISEEELLQVVEDINENPAIDGLIVQLPLPKHISVEKVTEKIKPEKDVDGFTPANVGRMALNWPTYVSATPNGIMELLKRYDIETSGKNCVVIGRSHIVGSPMSILMARNGNPGNATVTLTHSRTKNLPEIAKSADILIVALGKAGFVTADMVKEGAVVIDVGIHRIEDSSKKSGFRLVGDVNFEEVAEKASAITPVPGGVGPMTIASLLSNTLLAAEKKIYK
ncbi:bifunctional methylenetetrahydrofolate dehydrogenase/methenyltetrahydrofolate cyclohydrolase FolD [Litoribacter alkaliphilus]|uniref:Bifunctional protein FolD n=1 Tax=Litoribacter ruber TaxID=702568 RepID=A0AAP2G4U6_9BACT|nr:bifunctional methylenetetrahydrofolate dehydrogenase/methenyltetrahydrofolate cyclohydrolase FolD [Litoribacter alkaliphilus]MBS9524870.1 bifunctional methylenetetrahydrofolate dehydrogenase/methenyltetrahydrofolate cyclohydrolase FolD [Litoribacter alkaliphilus]